MKKLLVLDIDETLVYATNEKLSYEESFRFAEYYIYKRPHVDWFISEMRKTFNLGVWTSSGEVYAEFVISQLFQENDLELFWASKKCTLSKSPFTGEYETIKNLRKLRNKGYDLKDVIMVDDTASKHVKNYGNLVLVSEFIGDQNDNELILLADYLKQLSIVHNVRDVEKRDWKN